MRSSGLEHDRHEPRAARAAGFRADSALDLHRRRRPVDDARRAHRSLSRLLRHERARASARRGAAAWRPRGTHDGGAPAPAGAPRAPLSQPIEAAAVGEHAHLMSTFITRMQSHGSGVRLAVKDIIDVEGVATTAGSKALERRAQPAERDAACLAGARRAGARLVGKTNLHELAVLPLGTNPWYGTPVNPLDPGLIPGGSSSGSAVAVATEEADVALGSDTGGSVRVPAACCGVTGLKTTHGRVSLEGVWPLAPSLDTVGPMAAAVAGLVIGMQLLEPGFAPSAAPARTVGRLRTSAHPALEAAVDAALRGAELEVVALDWSDFETGTTCFSAIYFNELPRADRELAETDPEHVGADVIQTLGMVDP